MSTNSENSVKKQMNRDSISERGILRSSAPMLRTKLQPIRVKELLAMSQSDDEDDDDDESENNNDDSSANESSSSNQSLIDMNTSTNIEKTAEVPLNPGITLKNINPSSLLRSEVGKSNVPSLLSDFSQCKPTTSSHEEVKPLENQKEPLNYSNKQPIDIQRPSETPIKNHASTSRPVPSVSHRSLFHTPQEKLPRDFSNQSYLPTPATIFSHWSQTNMRHTPRVSEAAGPSQPLKESWPRTSSVRRPLMETKSSECHLPVENPADRGLAEKFIPRKVISECKENRRPSFEPLKNLDGAEAKLQADFSSLSTRPTVPEPSRVVEAGKKINSSLEYVKPNRPPTVQASVPARKPPMGKTMNVKGLEYMLLGSLGQGMSGSVIRVQDLSSGELRAIKCVDLSRMDKDSAQGCVQEITMLAKLQASCVIRMFNYEICNKMLYVVMELGETDLSKFLKSNCIGKRAPLTMILHYWTEMLTAVKHIHDHGVIHSDLKPANFVLVRGRLKLIDFGIASTLNADMTSVVKNTTVGTLNYISPEALMSVDDSSNQNTKFKINYKSDVWSLGCILYCLVFGQTPFQHIQNNWAKIHAITNSDFQISFNQSNQNDPVPNFLIDVIRNCLQRDPKARPSVAELLEVQYVPINRPNQILPNIPSNILRKIKHALDDDEWRQFIQIMEQFRNI